MDNKRHKEVINWLENSPDECYVMIMTKEDLESYSNNEVEMTDEEWAETLKGLNKWFVNESTWENLYEFLSDSYRARVRATEEAK